MELLIEGVSKRYAAHWALHDISLRCAPGLVGLVGPNGAGKTTLLRIVATLIPPTVGVVRWDGRDTRTHGAEVRRTLGYLPQEFGVYREFSARQFLRYLAALKGLPPTLARRRVGEVLELVNLDGVAERKLRTYSGGMKQRIGIAQALLNDPELLIVDEPTAGLDPSERVRFRTLLASLTTDRLVILSTHIIADVEAVASRLVVLQQGQVVADTTPRTMLARTMGHVWTVTTDAATAVRLQTSYTVSALVTQRDGVVVRVVSAARPHESAIVVEPSLEDAYLLAVGAQSSAT